MLQPPVPELRPQEVPELRPQEVPRQQTRKCVLKHGACEPDTRKRHCDSVTAAATRMRIGKVSNGAPSVRHGGVASPPSCKPVDWATGTRLVSQTRPK